MTTSVVCYWSYTISALLAATHRYENDEDYRVQTIIAVIISNGDTRGWYKAQTIRQIANEKIAELITYDAKYVSFVGRICRMLDS